MKENDNFEFLKSVYEQHLLQSRHIESERAWFMSVYAGITAALITFASKSNQFESWSIYFLLIFTLIGFALTWRWKLAFQHFRNQAEETAQKLNVEVNLKVVPDWHVFGTSYLFLYFYVIIFVGLFVMLLTS